MIRTIASLILLSASIAAAQTTAPTTAPAVKLTVTHSQLLGQTNRQSTRFGLVASPDIQRVAMFVQGNEKISVLLDGQVVAKHDWVIPQSAGFSPDHKHFGYIAQDGAEMFVMLNGQRRKPYYEVLPPLQLSLDGAHLLYVARPTGGKPRMVIDEKEGAAFDSIASIAVTGSFNRVCYAGVRDGATYVVDGTTETKLDARPADRVDVRLTPNGKHLRVVYAVGGKVFVRINGDRFGPYEEIRGMPAMPEDGSAWAVTAKIDGRWSVVENGKVIDTAESINGCNYAEKPARLVYTRRERATVSFMAGGKPLATVPAEIGFPAATFSSDYQRFAYPSQRGEDKQFVVIDGQEGPEFPRVLPPVFSNNSQHVGYFAATSRTDLVLMVDNRPRATLAGVQQVGSLVPVFSPSGKHVAFTAGPGNVNKHLYIDNVRGPEVHSHPAAALISWIDDQTLRLIDTSPEYRVTAYTIKVETK